MTYYDTIEEDLARAKAILEEGMPDEASLAGLPSEVRDLGGTIFGKDVHAAYKLLESFVEEIERLRAATPVALTSSELMALRDIVAHYLTIPDHSEVFIDVARDVETTPEALLRRLMAVAG
jgi:hypothetical protein